MVEANDVNTHKFSLDLINMPGRCYTYKIGISICILYELDKETTGNDAKEPMMHNADRNERNEGT